MGQIGNAVKNVSAGVSKAGQGLGHGARCPLRMVAKPGSNRQFSANLSNGSQVSPVARECRDVAEGIASADFSKVALNAGVLALGMVPVGSSGAKSALNLVNQMVQVASLAGAHQVSLTSTLRHPGARLMSAAASAPAQQQSMPETPGDYPVDPQPTAEMCEGMPCPLMKRDNATKEDLEFARQLNCENHMVGHYRSCPAGYPGLNYPYRLLREDPEIGQLNFEKAVKDSLLTPTGDVFGQVIPLTEFRKMSYDAAETVLQFGQHDNWMRLDGLGKKSRLGRGFDCFWEGQWKGGKLHGFGRELIYHYDKVGTDQVGKCTYYVGHWTDGVKDGQSKHADFESYLIINKATDDIGRGIPLREEYFEGERLYDNTDYTPPSD